MKESYGDLENLFKPLPASEDATTQIASFQNLYNPSRRMREIMVTHFIFNNMVMAVAVTGDTFPYKRYLNNEDVYTTKDVPPISIQCPLLLKYTSTEKNGIENLHMYAINHGKMKNISNFEDEFAAPWRTNGKAYVYWVVGPKEIQQSNTSTFL